MSGKLPRASPFRHVYGKPERPEKTWTNIKPRVGGDTPALAYNGSQMVFSNEGAGGVATVLTPSAYGQVSVDQPKLKIHAGSILDLSFSPFADNLLATASDDGTVKITNLPTGDLKEDITKSDATLIGHEKRVLKAAWNPSANNILASYAFDKTIKLWDVVNQSEAASIDSTKRLFDLAWNTDGSQMAYTSQEKKLFVTDPRAAEATTTLEGFEGVKPIKLFWMDKFNYLGALGFSRRSNRILKLWDTKNLTGGPVFTQDLGQASSLVWPYADNDLGLLYLAGKGDGKIGYFELADDSKRLYKIKDYIDSSSHKSALFVKKRFLDTTTCEIARAYRIVSKSIVPVSFIVPRKSESFQADIFPNCVGSAPGLDGKEWLEGKNGAPAKVSMNPADGALGGSAPVAFKAAKSPAELRKDLADAHARIKELEAEVARLKGA